MIDEKKLNEIFSDEEVVGIYEVDARGNIIRKGFSDKSYASACKEKIVFDEIPPHIFRGIWNGEEWEEGASDDYIELALNSCKKNMIRFLKNAYKTKIESFFPAHAQFNVIRRGEEKEDERFVRLEKLAAECNDHEITIKDAKTTNDLIAAKKKALDENPSLGNAGTAELKSSSDIIELWSDHNIT